MIGRNVKHTGVGKWSWNDRGITAGDGSLQEELLRIAATGALSDVQAGTVGQKVGLSKAIVRNLGCLEYSRRRKGLTEPSKYSPERNDQRRHRNYNLPGLSLT